MTIQEQAKSAFLDKAGNSCGVDPSTLLSELGNQLRTASGFSGELKMAHDLLRLDDATARTAVVLIPQLNGEIDLGICL